MIGRISNEQVVADGTKKAGIIIFGSVYSALLLFVSYAAFCMFTLFIAYVCFVLWAAFFLGVGFLIHNIAPDFFSKLSEISELKVIWFQEAIFSPPFY